MYGVMKAVRGWIQQFIVLSWKNWLIISRRRIGTVLIAVLPSLFILGASLLFKYLSDPTALDPTARLSKCTNFDVTSLPYTPTEYPCLTIGFAPNTGNVSAVMQAVAANSGLVFGEDVVGFEDADEAGRFIYRWVKPACQHAGWLADFLLAAPALARHDSIPTPPASPAAGTS